MPTTMAVGGVLDGATIHTVKDFTDHAMLHYYDGDGYVHHYVYTGGDFDYDESLMVPIKDLPRTIPYEARIFTTHLTPEGREGWIEYPVVECDVIPPQKQQSQKLKQPIRFSLDVFHDSVEITP